MHTKEHPEKFPIAPGLSGNPISTEAYRPKVHPLSIYCDCLPCLTAIEEDDADRDQFDKR